MTVHAFDYETKNWLRAKIIDFDEKRAKVTWTIYDNSYDCWIDRVHLRKPVELRSLVKRNSINKCEFPIRSDPKFLQGGDEIFDKGRNKEYVVAINDKFKAEVN